MVNKVKCNKTRHVCMVTWNSLIYILWFWFCISVWSNNIKHLLFCLLTVCISSLEKYSDPLTIFDLSYFSCYWVLRRFFSFILFAYWALIKYIFKYFLSFCGWSFHFIDSVLCTKLFHFDEVQRICIFFSFTSVLVSYLRNHYQVHVFSCHI